MTNFGKRSRSPNQGRQKEMLFEEFSHIVGTLMQTLQIENHNEVIQKVKEMKHYQKKHQKERKLIVNLQKMVKDCTLGSMGTLIPSNPT